MEIEMLPPTPVGSTVPDEQKAQLKNLAQDYEGVFLNQLVSAMRKTVPENEFMPTSHAEKVYRSMLDQEYAKQLAKSEQIGLSKVVYAQLLRAAEKR